MRPSQYTTLGNSQSIQMRECVCVCVAERHHHNSSLWAHLQVLTVPSPKGISPTLRPSFSSEQGSIFLFFRLFALSLPLSLLPPNNSIHFRAWPQTLTVALNVLNSTLKKKQKKTAIAIHLAYPFNTFWSAYTHAAFKSRRNDHIYEMSAHEWQHNVIITSGIFIEFRLYELECVI